MHEDMILDYISKYKEITLRSKWWKISTIRSKIKII
jgi:hypothetical protein